MASQCPPLRLARGADVPDRATGGRAARLELRASGRPDNLALRYPAAEAGLFNIGVLHTSLSGRAGHARYAPCEIDDLNARGYDYWALGHVHAYERVCEDPAVVFPGNLQGRNIRETGAKGAVLVEVQDRAVSRIEPVELDVLRWARVPVDCTGCDTIDAVHARIGEALSAARTGAATNRGLIVRVVLEGETPFAHALADRSAELRDDARVLAGSIAPDLWIEKLSVHTQPLAADASRAGGGSRRDAGRRFRRSRAGGSARGRADAIPHRRGRRATA